MVGSWRGSNGWEVRIPAGNGAFKLVFVRGKERVEHPARWLKPGEKFQWTDKQSSVHTAEYEPKQDRIRDLSAAWPDSPAYWYRVKL